MNWYNPKIKLPELMDDGCADGYDLIISKSSAPVLVYCPDCLLADYDFMICELSYYKAFDGDERYSWVNVTDQEFYDFDEIQAWTFLDPRDISLEDTNGN